MPNTRLTKERLKNHMQYAKALYIVFALAAWFVVDLLYTTTAYRAPAERKVDIEVVGTYAEIGETLEAVAANALAVGQAFDTTLEEVNFYSISYSGESDDVYGAQKYMVMMAAQEGDVYIVNKTLMQSLVAQGGALPLDDFIAQGLLDPGERDLEEVTFYEPVEEGATPSDATHVYALQASTMNRMLEEDINYDIRDKYLVVMAYCKNPETTAVVLQSVIDQLDAPKPDWLVELEAKQAAEAADGAAADSNGETSDGAAGASEAAGAADSAVAAEDGAASDGVAGASEAAGAADSAATDGDGETADGVAGASEAAGAAEGAAAADGETSDGVAGASEAAGAADSAAAAADGETADGVAGASEATGAADSAATDGDGETADSAAGASEAAGAAADDADAAADIDSPATEAAP